MNLGLGLGFLRNTSGTSSGADWSGYDGTNDAAQQLLFADGDNFGPSAFTPSSATEFVLTTRDRNNTQTRRMGVVSIDGTSVTLENEYNISSIAGNEGVFPSMTRTKMGGDRYLTLYTGSGGDFLVLHTKSGVTLSQTDIDTTMTPLTANRNFRSIDRLDDDTAVMFYSPASGTTYRVVTIDITGDNISFGTAVDTGGSTSASRYGALTVIDSGHLICAYDTDVYLFSRSRSTLTLEDNIDVRSDAAAMLDVAGSDIVRDGYWAVAYEFGATTQLQVIEYDTSTNKLTRGNSVQLNNAGSFNGPQEASLAQANEGVLLAAICESSANGTNIFRITVDGDGVIANSEIKNVDGDHPYFRMMEGKNQAVLLTQFSDTGPIDKVAVYVLQP